MDKEITRVINEGASTFLNIAQMTQYRIKYAQDRDKDSEKEMYKYAFLSGIGIACLFAIGISGLMNSHNNS